MSNLLNAQSFFNSLEIGVVGAYQKYDNRLYEFAVRSSHPSHQLRFQEGGDYQYAFSLTTNFYTYKSWSFYLGAGYTKEINTFRRPFNHCYFTGTPCTLILLRMDRYENDLFLFPVEVQYDWMPAKKFGIHFNLQLLPSINFFKRIESGSRIPYEKAVFDFYALEVNPGIGIKIFDRFGINLNYRAFQLKQLDKILFYSVLFENPNDAPKEKYETYNPHKMWLSLRYELFRFKKVTADN